MYFTNSLRTTSLGPVTTDYNCHNFRLRTFSSVMITANDYNALHS